MLLDILSGKGKNKNKDYSVSDLVDLWTEHTSVNKKQADFAEPASLENNNQVVNLPNQSTSPATLRKGSTVSEKGADQGKMTLRQLKKGPQSASRDLLKHMAIMREGASVWRQLMYCHNRSIMQQHRQVQSFGLELGVSALAGGLMGLSVMGVSGEMFRGFYVYPMTGISPAPIAWIIPLFGMLNAMAVGIAGAPAGVKTFGEEKPLFYREHASGHSALAYYVGKSISVVYRFILTSLHFTAIVYFLGTPIITFARMFTIILMLFYCVFGLSSVVSMFTRRENASLLSVVVCLFAATLCGFGPTLQDARGWGMMWLWQISYAKWGAEALYSQEVGFFKGVYDIQSSADVYGYDLNNYSLDIGMMMVIGTALRILSFSVMMFFQRKRV